MRTEPNELPDRWRRIVQRVAAGAEWSAAAKAEGCSDSYAHAIPARMKKHPAVATMLEEIRAKGMEMAVYDLAAAMREAQEVIDFAKANRNSMAYFKAVQHRAALSGLLIEEIHLRHESIDLAGALAEARHRVLDITPRETSTPFDPFEDGAVNGGR